MPRCDIEEVIVTATSGALIKKYKLAWVPVIGGLSLPGFIDDPPKTSVRSIALAGAAPKSPNNVLQVISFPKGAKKIAKVKVAVQPLGGSRPAHVSCQIARPDEAPLFFDCSSQTKTEFEVYSRPHPDDFIGIFARYFNYGAAINEYSIDVNSCGYRDSEPAIHTAHLLVQVFPADQVKLALRIPSLKKYSREGNLGLKIGAKSDKSTGFVGVADYTEKKQYNEKGAVAKYSDSTDYVKETKTSSTEVTHGGNKYSSKQTSDTKDGFDIDHPATADVQDADPDVPDIQLTVNDAAIDAGNDLKKILNVINKVKKGIKGIEELLRDWVPQVGFKFEFEAEILSGSITATWGYKEHTDYRVYYGLDLDITITILKISLMLSFGVKIGPALARVEGGVKDGKLTVGEKWTFNGPDRPIDPSFKETVEIPVILRGRAEASILSLKVKEEVGVKSGLNVGVDIKLDHAHRFNFETKTKWLGLVGYVIRKESPLEAEEGEEWRFIDESTIWEGKLPL